jgi:hypothetical protein
VLSVVKASGATVVNAALPLWVQTGSLHGLNPGLLCDPYYAAFQIYSAAGTQVYPVAAGTRQVVDLVAHRIDKGHYAAVWNSASAALGAYNIRWYVVPVNGDAEVTFDQDFEVVTRAFPGRNYCSLASLRDDGLSANAMADDRAQRLIVQASSMVEMYTGRVFAPVAKTIRVDGTNSRALPLQEPIVAIQGLAVSLVSQFTSSDLEVLADTFRVYNRHLSIGLSQPDDRENPKLEFVHDDDLKGVNYVVPTSGYRLTQLIWPRGQQNVRIVGVFGYTEPDGSWCGRTPDMIQMATRLLCFRYKSRPGTDDRDDATKRGRLISEHTKDQGYQLANISMFAGYTGDPEVDGILASFTRPPRFGAA